MVVRLDPNVDGAKQRFVFGPFPAGTRVRRLVVHLVNGTGTQLLASVSVVCVVRSLPGVPIDNDASFNAAGRNISSSDSFDQAIIPFSYLQDVGGGEIPVSWVATESEPYLGVSLAGLDDRLDGSIWIDRG